MDIAVPCIAGQWQRGREMSQQRDALLYRLETAGAEEFAALVRDTGEVALREIFGDGVDELCALAQPTRAPKLGNVVVLHGILGAHLAEGGSTIWLNPCTKRGAHSGVFRVFLMKILLGAASSNSTKM